MPTLSQLDDDGLSRLKVENLQHILETDSDAFGTLVRNSLDTFDSPSLLTLRSMSSEDGTALAQHLELTVIQPIAAGRETGASVLQARRVVRRILKELPLPPGVDAREAEDARCGLGVTLSHEDLFRHVAKLAHLPSNSGAGDVRKLFDLLEGNCESEARNVKDGRQLRLIGPTNNGKSHLARLVAQMWVASAAAKDGRWIETTIKMTTMEEHLWSAREDSGDGTRREVWGPLKYLWERAKANEAARFALILNESNRGGLFNILNGVWWEKRRAIGDELNLERDPPANLALIFTENPATADYSVVGGDDEALRARLGARDTVAVVHGGVDERTLRDYKKLSDGTIPVGSEETANGSFKLPDGSTRAPEGKMKGKMRARCRHEGLLGQLLLKHGSRYEQAARGAGGAQTPSWYGAKEPPRGRAASHCLSAGGVPVRSIAQELRRTREEGEAVGWSLGIDQRRRGK